MTEGRPLGRERLADVNGDARIRSGAVPVAPVNLHLAEGGWHLIRCGFELLQADDIRTLLRDPFLDLRLARPDTVDVPGGEFHGTRGVGVINPVNGERGRVGPHSAV